MTSPEDRGLVPPVVADYPERNRTSAQKPRSALLKSAAAGCQAALLGAAGSRCFPEGALTDPYLGLSREPKGAPGTLCTIQAKCLCLQGSYFLATCKCTQSSPKGHPGEKPPDLSF